MDTELISQEILSQPETKLTLAEQFRILGQTVTHPKRAIELIARHSLWIAPLIVSTFLSMLLLVWTWPFTRRALELSVPPGTPPARLALLHRQLEIGRWISFASVPVMIVVQCLIAAAVVWLFANAIIGNCPFKKVFGLVMHGNLIRMVATVYEAVVLTARGLGSIRSAADLNAPFGLDAFIRTSDPVYRVILARFNFVEVLYLVFITIGVAIICRSSERRAAAVSVGQWAASIALQALVLSLTQIFKR
jgi:hypothetical protein